MAEEELGFIELEWTCEACGSKNKGTSKTCVNCGAVMGAKAKFEVPVEADLITDVDQLAKAERGPDFYCAYCGGRNAAGNQVCSQCGASLAEATARQKGEVLGAFVPGDVPDVKCPFCGEMNDARALKCRVCGGSLAQKTNETPQAAAPPSRGGKGWIWGAAGVALLLLCLGGFYLLFGRTSEVTATVQGVSWNREIDVMEQRPVKHEAWQDQIPTGAQKGSCASKIRRTQADPAPNATKVCGTPYAVDQGNGTGKVMRECVYQVPDNWCTYTQNEWTVINHVAATGSDYDPRWPVLQLRSDQKEGDRREKLEVVFNSNGKQYKYGPNSKDFANFAVESRWTLKVNSLGGVNGAAKAN